MFMHLFLFLFLFIFYSLTGRCAASDTNGPALYAVDQELTISLDYTCGKETCSKSVFFTSGGVASLWNTDEGTTLVSAAHVLIDHSALYTILYCHDGSVVKGKNCVKVPMVPEADGHIIGVSGVTVLLRVKSVGDGKETTTSFVCSVETSYKNGREDEEGWGVQVRGCVPEGSGAGVRLAYYDSAEDLGILTLPHDPTAPIIKIGQLKKGTRVRLVVPNKDGASYTSIREGVFGEPTVCLWKEFGTASVIPKGGESGSPLLDENGFLVGVASGVIPGDEPMGRYVPAGLLEKVLMK